MLIFNKEIISVCEISKAKNKYAFLTLFESSQRLYSRIIMKSFN